MYLSYRLMQKTNIALLNINMYYFYKYIGEYVQLLSKIK